MVAASSVTFSVTLAPNGFYPRSFRWRGRTVRVLSVDRISTWGAERRFAVRTAMGSFELGCTLDARAWLVRREPGWFDRIVARLHRLPRYPLPPWKRRSFVFAAAVVREVRREGYANRLALVRQ